MTKPRTRRELADEAYLRAQQIDIDGELAAILTPAVDLAIEADAVPRQCPGCGREQTLAHGWTLVRGNALQCGGCGCRVAVPADAYNDLAAQMARLLAARTAKIEQRTAKKAVRPKRTRGAG